MTRHLLTICDRLDLFPWFNRFTRNKAPVFMLHHFCASGHRDAVGLPADILETCLRYLASHDYRVLPLSEYVHRLMAGEPLYKTVVFTVDDGHIDFLHHGFPLFKKFNFPVAVFLATSYVEGRIHLWWDQIRDIIRRTRLAEIDVAYKSRRHTYPLRTATEKEGTTHAIVEEAKLLSKQEIRQFIASLRLAGKVARISRPPQAMSWEDVVALERQGVEFYPHTKEHPILSRCSGAEIRDEIYGSLEALARYSQKPVNIFCYPNGRECDFDDRVVATLEEAGFVAAFTTVEGFDRSGDQLDMFRLHRYPFPNEPTRFKQLISGLEAFKHRLRPN